MSMFTDTIQLTIKVAAESAKSQIKGLSNEVKQSEGAWNKFKTAGGGALDMVKNNATAFAVTAGAAVAGFSVKAIGDFQKTALGAGQLSSALGISTEDASKLQEVSGDLGIGLGTVERSIGRMNRTIGTSPEKFEAAGVAIKRTKDGAVDVTGTFLNVIDAINGIEDPAKRAAVAQDLLGRGWQDMSRLIALGADGVKSALDGVEKAKIISSGQVSQAERFRDTMDNLRGVAESASLTVGQLLVPAIESVASQLDRVSGPLESVISLLTKLKDSSVPPSDKPLGWLDIPKKILNDPLDLKGNWDLFMRSFNESMGKGAANVQATLDPALVQQWTDANRQAAIEQEASAAAAERVAKRTAESQAAVEAAAGAQKAYDDFISGVNDALDKQLDLLGKQIESAGSAADAQLTQNDALARFGEVLGNAESSANDVAAAAANLSKADLDLANQQAAAAGQTLNSTQKLDIQKDSLLKTATAAQGPARTAILNYIFALLQIPPDRQTDIITLLDQGKVDEARAQIDDASRTRHTAVNVDDNGTAAATQRNIERNIPSVRNVTVRVNPNYGQDTVPRPIQGNSAEGRFVPGGANFLTTTGEESGRGGDEVILPLGDPRRMAALLSDPRVGPRVMAALGGGAGGGSAAAVAGAFHLALNITLAGGMRGGSGSVHEGHQIANSFMAWLRTGGAAQIRRELGL